LSAEADRATGNDRDAAGKIEDLSGIHFIAVLLRKFLLSDKRLFITHVSN
jgi:hypothetical protein